MSVLIPPEDLTVSLWPEVARGGQHVGVPRGVKIVHEPSGLVAISMTSGSQHRNRQVALDMILGGLTSPAYRGQ